jgi:hypothetical protein
MEFAPNARLPNAERAPWLKETHRVGQEEPESTFSNRM